MKESALQNETLSENRDQINALLEATRSQLEKRSMEVGNLTSKVEEMESQNQDTRASLDDATSKLLAAQGALGLKGKENEQLRMQLEDQKTENNALSNEV